MIGGTLSKGGRSSRVFRGPAASGSREGLVARPAATEREKREGEARCRTKAKDVAERMAGASFSHLSLVGRG